MYHLHQAFRLMRRTVQHQKVYHPCNVKVFRQNLHLVRLEKLQPLLQKLRWLRVLGDTIFACGAIGIGCYLTMYDLSRGFFVLLFAIGLLVNLGLALAPAPDILQTIGTAVRNAGIVGMGYALVSRRKDPEA